MKDEKEYNARAERLEKEILFALEGVADDPLTSFYGIETNKLVLRWAARAAAQVIIAWAYGLRQIGKD